LRGSHDGGLLDYRVEPLTIHSCAVERLTNGPQGMRYQRLMGNQCQWVWADDAHGTPIMLRAQQEGITPEELIDKTKASHERDIAGFLLSPDNFHTTHSDENREMAEMIYTRLDAAGLIKRETIKQLYDAKENMFLPDRYVKGICPNCGTADQYGDNCESCSATYDATELKNPVSQVSGTEPELRDSEQHFFALSEFNDMLKQWTAGPAVQDEVGNKLKEWLDTGLQNWDISRNAPYFGFEIPNAPGKYFYVWLDAPIGYIASHLHLTKRTGENFEDSWKPNSDVELYHFIGKDIINFHCLFWPALLEGAGFRKPTGVFCHGFVMLDDDKMSKSRGTFVSAATWLEHIKPEYLRYYYASKLNSGITDFNLNLDDFVTRVNADLVGKVVNIASRCAGFISKQFNGMLSEQYPQTMLDDYNKLLQAKSDIMNHYESREFGKAMREIMVLAEHANTYINDAEPWVKIKQEGSREEVQAICTVGLNYFRIIMTYLSPVLPELSAKTESFLNTKLTMAALDAPLVNHEIEKFKPLMTRIEPAQVEKMMAATAKQNQAVKVVSAAGSSGSAKCEPIKDEIEIGDFEKVDLRVATIVDAKPVEGADKLIELTLDIGMETRTVFAGLKAAYNPDDLVGRQTVMVANLKPRKMRFGISSGMVLAAGPGGADLFILSPDTGAQAGMRAK